MNGGRQKNTGSEFPKSSFLSHGGHKQWIFGFEKNIRETGRAEKIGDKR